MSEVPLHMPWRPCWYCTATQASLSASSNTGRRCQEITRQLRKREVFIGNLLVRIHFIIVMIRWIGRAPWEFEFPQTPSEGIGLFPPLWNLRRNVYWSQCRTSNRFLNSGLQGYLAYKKHPPRRTLQQPYA